jgi:hypothetical protein
MPNAMTEFFAMVVKSVMLPDTVSPEHLLIVPIHIRAQTIPVTKNSTGVTMSQTMPTVMMDFVAQTVDANHLVDWTRRGVFMLHGFALTMDYPARMIHVLMKGQKCVRII